MVSFLIESLCQSIKEGFTYIPPGIFIAIATAFLVEGKYFKEFRQECLGSLLMIVCTFSAGKWIGRDSMQVAWASHFLGVITSDYFGGGPHVNPAVTFNMFCLGKVSYTEAYIRVAAQMTGGLIAFPAFHAISDAMGLTPFGGPEFKLQGDQPVEAFLSEFCAMFLLLMLIYTVNWEYNFGTYHYIIKQSLTAIGIRTLIEVFPTAGPAMNPMLATTWNVFGVGTTFEFPRDMDHYIVYWISPGISAIVAAVVYVIYAGGTIFGTHLPIGPIKKQPPTPVNTGKKNK
jgi:glycerol uptake facilitator-like aquaporin